MAKITKRDAESIKNKVAKLTRWTPNDLQTRVKARFYRRLEEMDHVLDKETVLQNQDLLVQMAGSKQITKWMQQEAFAEWFLDEKVVRDRLTGLLDKCVDTLENVLQDDESLDSDRLKAIRMVMELTSMFPGKESTVRFLDDRLEQMSDAETESEIKKLQSKLLIDGD